MLPYETQEKVTGPTQYDVRGRSTYARRMEALVALLRADRGVVRDSADVVHQLLVMDRLLSDELDCRGSSLGVYAPNISHGYVQNIGAEFHDLASYAVNSLASEAQASWHMDAITAFSRGTEASDRSVLTEVFFRIANASESDNLSPRVLKQLLARVLSLSGDVAIAERWLACSQNLETKSTSGPRLVLIHIFTVVPFHRADVNTSHPARCSSAFTALTSTGPCPKRHRESLDSGPHRQSWFGGASSIAQPASHRTIGRF